MKPKQTVLHSGESTNHVEAYTQKGALYLLSPAQIDFTQWDNALVQSNEEIIYARSWYLNTVAKKWWAIVEIADNKYVSIMPLPVKEFLGIKKVYQPFFTQQLGLFTTDKSQITSLAPYLQIIKENFPVIYYQLNTQNKLSDFPDLNSNRRITYELNLHQEYQLLFKNYSENLKRNLKKGSGLTISTAENIDALISLFRKYKGKEVTELKDKDYAVLQKLYKQLQRKQAALVLEAYQDKKLVAGALFTVHKNKIIYLFGASSETGKKTGAMSVLLDFVVRKYAGTPFILDFEGSNMPGLAKFYANFGAQPLPYLAIQNKTLPWYLKWLRP